MEWISSKVSNRGAVHDGAVRYDSRFDQRLHRVSAAVWVYNSFCRRCAMDTDNRFNA